MLQLTVGATQFGYTINSLSFIIQPERVILFKCALDYIIVTMVSRKNHLEQLKLSKIHGQELFVLAAATHHICTPHKSRKDQCTGLEVSRSVQTFLMQNTKKKDSVSTVHSKSTSQ